MRARAASGALGLAMLVFTSRAHAHPCDSPWRGAGNPIRVPLGPADFGVLPEACAATTIAFESRLVALVATEEFYGSLLAGGFVRARVALQGRSFVSFTAPGLDYRFVANATVEAKKTSVGAGSLGFHYALPAGDALALTPYVRVLVPTESAFDAVTRTGFDHGVSGILRVSSRVEVVGGYGVLVLATTGSGRTHAELSPSLGGDAVYRPWRALGLAAGAGLRFVPNDPRPFESFDPRVSIRLYPWRGAFANIDGVFPLWGHDRTDAAGSLRLGWDWGP